jgi:hypothetical protein
MPQKRPKNSRNPLLIAPGSIALYQTGLRTKPCWDACRANRPVKCTHPECDEYYAAFHALNMASNVLPHQPSPLYSYEHIRGYPDHERTTAIKQALDAALAAGEDRKND